MKRALRPRATANLAVLAVLVSDRTAPHVLGLEPRAFRDLVAGRHIRHELIGRRVVARVDDVLEALGLADVAGVVPEFHDDEQPANDPPTSSPRVTGVDAVLARIGRARRRPA